ncbi:MAG: hypothetical protein K0S08_893 [Gammaproteobacteria bacterium]|jgi:osmotically-inducible protein OsmY|nr:hypothetical protein [Gammaproteobacteria bacterium]
MQQIKSQKWIGLSALFLLSIAFAEDKTLVEKTKTAFEDAKLATVVKSKFYTATVQNILKSPHINAKAESGIVTLVGCTEDPEDIHNAQIIAENVKGVKNVVNKIELNC